MKVKLVKGLKGLFCTQLEEGKCAINLGLLRIVLICTVFCCCFFFPVLFLTLCFRVAPRWLCRTAAGSVHGVCSTWRLGSVGFLSISSGSAHSSVLFVSSCSAQLRLQLSVTKIKQRPRWGQKVSLCLCRGVGQGGGLLLLCLLGWLEFCFWLVGLCVKKYFVKLLTIVSIS